MAGPKRLVREDLLQCGLRIVERAVDRQREHIVGTGAGHLALLQRRNPSVRIENEDCRTRPANQSVDGRRPGVAGGGAQHIDRLTPHLALVAVELPQQLEREVLERERRAMEQLEHLQVRPQTPERRNRRVGEPRIRPIHELPQFRRRDVRREHPHELVAEVRVTEPRPPRQLPGQIRQLLRQEQPAVRRQPRRYGVREPERRSLTAGGNEFHGKRSAVSFGRQAN